jgi:hypothetical protein
LCSAAPEAVGAILLSCKLRMTADIALLISRLPFWRRRVT